MLRQGDRHQKGVFPHHLGLPPFFVGVTTQNKHNSQATLSDLCVLQCSQVLLCGSANLEPKSIVKVASIFWYIQLVIPVLCWTVPPSTLPASTSTPLPPDTLLTVVVVSPGEQPVLIITGQQLPWWSASEIQRPVFTSVLPLPAILRLLLQLLSFGLPSTSPDLGETGGPTQAKQTGEP